MLLLACLICLICLRSLTARQASLLTASFAFTTADKRLVLFKGSPFLFVKILPKSKAIVLGYA